MAFSPQTYVYRRRLPHLQTRGKTYFLTFCTLERRVLSPVARSIVWECMDHDHRLTYWLHSAVVMPDHAHMVFSPYDGWLLAKIMERVKSVSCRLINKALGTKGSLWQHESHDHILRSDESLAEKVEYIRDNPVIAGLASAPNEYLWLWPRADEDAAGVGGATSAAPAPEELPVKKR